MACLPGLYSRDAYCGYYHPALGGGGFLSNRRGVSGYCYSRGFYLESAIGTGIARRAFWYVFWLAWTIIFSRHCIFRIFILAGARDAGPPCQPILFCLAGRILAGDRAGTHQIAALYPACFTCPCLVNCQCTTQPACPAWPDTTYPCSDRLWPGCAMGAGSCRGH